MNRYRLTAAAAAVLAATSVASAYAEQSPMLRSQHQHHMQANASTGAEASAFQELQRAAQRLREAIQAMAQQPVGSQREVAMRAAHEALFDTNQAMLRLPAPMRGQSAASAGARGSYASSGGGSVGARADASGARAETHAVAGGVGINARARLADHAAPDHNVKMVFALNTGNYVSDVQVQVKDQSGSTVIDGVAQGPWLYARLPAGSYSATARYAGQSVTEQFTVGRSGQRTAIFRWPVSVEANAAAGVAPILGTGPQNQPPATAR